MRFNKVKQKSFHTSDHCCDFLFSFISNVADLLFCSTTELRYRAMSVLQPIICNIQDKVSTVLYTVYFTVSFKDVHVSLLLVFFLFGSLETVGA